MMPPRGPAPRWGKLLGSWRESTITRTCAVCGLVVKQSTGPRGGNRLVYFNRFGREVGAVMPACSTPKKGDRK
jgi:hypothetical protein